MTATEHKISSGVPAAQRRQVLVRGVLLGVVAISAGLYGQLRPGASRIVLFGALLLIVPAAALGLYIGLRRQTKAYRSFRIVRDGDTVTRHIDGFEELTLRRSEVERLLVIPGEGLLLTTADRHRQLFVPDALDDYQGFVHAVSSWAPVEEQARRSLSQYLPLVIFAISAGLLAISLHAERFGVLAPVNILLVTGLGTGLFYTFRSPHIARWAKLGSLLVIPLLLGIAYRVWLAR